jgi:hypothetical protein
MSIFLVPGGKNPVPPRKGGKGLPKPPSHIPWPVPKPKSGGGCFPPGGIPGKQVPEQPVRHPHKAPTPNRRGR